MDAGKKGAAGQGVAWSITGLASPSQSPASQGPGLEKAPAEVRVLPVWRPPVVN